MAVSRIEGDLYVYGNLSSKTVTLPDGGITNAMIAAATGIDATKVDHQHRGIFSQPNTTATSETKIVHVCYGATGTVVAFKAGSIVANIGAATVTLDLKKNGATILSAVITLDSANTTYVVEAGTINSAALVAGDVLTVVTVATAGGGTLATGLFAAVTVNEDAL